MEEFILILLYSNGCSKCKIIKQKLDQKQVIYEECNDMNIILKKGFMSMPMLEVDGEVMNYLNAINWLKEI